MPLIVNAEDECAEHRFARYLQDIVNNHVLFRVQVNAVTRYDSCLNDNVPCIQVPDYIFKISGLLGKESFSITSSMTAIDFNRLIKNNFTDEGFAVAAKKHARSVIEEIVMSVHGSS